MSGSGSLVLLNSNVAVGNASVPFHCFRGLGDGSLVIGRDNLGIKDSIVAAGNVEITGMTRLKEVQESVETKTGATGVVSHDFSNGSIWLHTAIGNSFTTNFLNVPTTNSKASSVNLVLAQGANAYIANAVQISGTAQTVKWLGGVIPLGTPNGVDIQNFVLLRNSDAWTVLSSLSSFTN